MFGELLYHTDVANEDHKKQEDLCPGGQWSRMHPLSTHTNVWNAGSRGGQSGPFQGAVVSPWDRTTASVPGILFKYPLFLGKKQKEFLVSVLYSDSRVSNPVPLAGRQGPEREGVSPGAHAALRGALPSQRGHELLLTRGSSSFSVGGALLDRGGEWGRSRGTDIF